MFDIYKKTVQILRKKLPPAFPVSVKRVAMKGKDGYCTKKNDKFHIRINNSLDEAQSIDALLHEWAHARSWSHLHDSLEGDDFEEVIHNAAWGVAYSEVYRVYIDFLKINNM